MRSHVAVALLAVTAILCHIDVAQADPIRIGFTVRVNFVAGDMTGIFGVPISEGDMLHGSLAFDPVGASDASSDPFFGSYAVPGQVALHVGSGLAGALEPIQVYDDRFGIGYPTDALAALSEHITAPGYYGLVMITEFYGSPGNQSGAPLPRTAAEFRAGYNLRGTFSLRANQTGVEPPWDDTTHSLFGSLAFEQPSAPVPEPATLLLLGPAVGICVRRLRRRNRLAASV